MNWLKDLLGADKIIDTVGGIIDEAFDTDEEKAKRKDEFSRFLKSHEEKQMNASVRIIEAEMNQEDKFTKRARPAIVWSGLLFVFLSYILFPVISHFTGSAMPKIEIPTEFWNAWMMTVSIYGGARAWEKVKGVSK